MTYFLIILFIVGLGLVIYYIQKGEKKNVVNEKPMFEDVIPKPIMINGMSGKVYRIEPKRKVAVGVQRKYKDYYYYDEYDNLIISMATTKGLFDTFISMVSSSNNNLPEYDDIPDVLAVEPITVVKPPVVEEIPEPVVYEGTINENEVIHEIELDNDEDKE